MAKMASQGPFVAGSGEDLEATDEDQGLLIMDAIAHHERRHDSYMDQQFLAGK